ncbi:hypothetical protein LXL04_028062 [Taraxacum kok-saghyz]
MSMADVGAGGEEVVTFERIEILTRRLTLHISNFLNYHFLTKIKLSRVTTMLNFGSASYSFKDKFEPSYKGLIHEMFTMVLRGLSATKLTRLEKFRSCQDGYIVKSSLKVEDGVLYPLERNFFFLPKPQWYRVWKMKFGQQGQFGNFWDLWRCVVNWSNCWNGLVIKLMHGQWNDWDQLCKIVWKDWRLQGQNWNSADMGYWKLIDQRDATFKKVEKEFYMPIQIGITFPEDAMLSPEAKDLIYRLLCDMENRLGTSGPDQIKSHPWFKDVMWDQLYEMEAAFKPEVNEELDTQSFMKFDELNPPTSGRTSSGPSRKHQLNLKDLNFVGYTYMNFDAVKVMRDNPDLMRSASSDSLYGKQNNLISMT